MYTRTKNGKQEFSTCKTIKTSNGVWISNPTAKQIAAEGWKEYVAPPVDPVEIRKAEILQELSSMDYLTSKYVDGEDMSQYGDWQGKRRALREEYRELIGEAGVTASDKK